MATITKKDLVEKIAEKTDQTQVMTKKVVQLFLDAIVEELAAGNRIEFREFGVFETRERQPRRARNPRTNEGVAVGAKTVVSFKAGRVMKMRVQRGAAARPRGEGGAGSGGTPEGAGEAEPGRRAP